MRRPLLLLLKAAISLLLLYLSLRSVNLAALGERISRLNIAWIAAALLLQALQVALQAFRWRAIVMQCGSNLAPRAALRINFIAQFFQPGAAINGWRRRRPHLAACPRRRRLGERHLFGLDRPDRGHIRARHHRHCLSALDACARPDPIARAIMLLIGAGAVAGGGAFIMIGRLRWRAARALRTKPPSGRGFAHRLAGMSVLDVRRHRLCPVLRHPFADDHIRMVHRSISRCDRRFRPFAVPDPAGHPDRDRPDIDRRLGLARRQHDRRLHLCRPRRRRRPYRLGPDRSDRLRRRRGWRHHLDSERCPHAGAAVRSRTPPLNG